MASVNFQVLNLLQLRYYIKEATKAVEDTW